MTSRWWGVIGTLAAVSLAGCVGRQPAEAFDSGVLPNAIELSVDSLVLSVGDTATIEATVLDGFGVPMQSNVGWTSASAAVATVMDVTDSGLVEAVSPGLTTVQATVLGTSVPARVVPVRVN